MLHKEPLKRQNIGIEFQEAAVLYDPSHKHYFMQVK